jgi:FixJ family two-component response regulator
LLARVALVDDDVSVRKALTRLLESAGLQVLACASAAEFLESGLPKALECLILDIHLGGMSGLELLAHLRSTGQDLPTVLITAHDDLQSRELAAKSGCTAYLLKPLNAPVFLKEVFGAMNREFPR